MAASLLFLERLDQRLHIVAQRLRMAQRNWQGEGWVCFPVGARRQLFVRVSELGHLEAAGYPLEEETLAFRLTGVAPTGEVLVGLVLEDLIGQQGTPEQRQERLEKLAQGPRADTKVLAAGHLPGMTASDRIRLASSPLNPVLEAFLLQDPEPQVRIALAAKTAERHPSTLQALVHDPDPSVRQALAGSNITPSDLRHRLLHDSAPGVRAALSQHGDAELLEALSRDRDPSVRELVVRHRLLSPERLDEMAGDGSAAVRRMVALQVQGRTLEQLLTDPDVVVRAAAAANPALSAELMPRLLEDQRAVVVSLSYNPSLSLELALRILDLDDQELTAGLASRCGHQQVLAKLVAKKQHWSHLASNPRTPRSAILNIAGSLRRSSTNTALKRQLIRHQSLGPADRTKLRRRFTSYPHSHSTLGF